MSKINKGTIQAWLPTIAGIVIVLLIGGGILAWQYLKVPKEEIKAPAEEEVSLPIPTALGLSFLSGIEPFIQITWDYEIADYFNIYRATNPEGPWEKIIENFPRSAHTAVDYHYPKDAKVLYYRITSVDETGNESKPSEVSSVNIGIDETANWKTYINAYLEVKYPTNYFYFFQPGNQSTYEKFEFANNTDFVGSFNRDSGSILSIQDKKYQEGGYEWPRIEIRVSKPTTLSLAQWENKYLQEERTNIVFPPATTRYINGSEILTVSLYASGTKELLEQYNFIRSSGNRIAIIACLYGDPKCDQILSTFKFTN